MSSGPYIHLCGLLASLGIPGLKWPASKGAITIDCSAAVAWARISFLATILYIYIQFFLWKPLQKVPLVSKELQLVLLPQHGRGFNPTPYGFSTEASKDGAVDGGS